MYDREEKKELYTAFIEGFISNAKKIVPKNNLASSLLNFKVKLLLLGSYDVVESFCNFQDAVQDPVELQVAFSRLIVAMRRDLNPAEEVVENVDPMVFLRLLVKQED